MICKTLCLLDCAFFINLRLFLKKFVLHLTIEIIINLLKSVQYLL